MKKKTTKSKSEQRRLSFQRPQTQEQAQQRLESVMLALEVLRPHFVSLDAANDYRRISGGPSGVAVQFWVSPSTDEASDWEE